MDGTQERQKTRSWGLYPLAVQENDGDFIANMFDKVMSKCPDFYKIGLQKDFFKIQPTDAIACLAGATEADLLDLFLPDRNGFIYYYNLALEDLPIIFDLGATVFITPDYRDFVTFKEGGSLGVSTINGQSQVKRSGLVCWAIYNNDRKNCEIIT